MPPRQNHRQRLAASWMSSKVIRMRIPRRGLANITTLKTVPSKGNPNLKDSSSLALPWSDSAIMSCLKRQTEWDLGLTMEQRLRKASLLLHQNLWQENQKMLVLAGVSKDLNLRKPTQAKIREVFFLAQDSISTKIQFQSL